MNMLDTDKLMIEAFDYDAFYDAEIKPLVKTLHEKCAANNLPMVVAVAYSNKVNPDKTAGGFGIGHACHLPGPGRTPVTFRLAESAISDPLDKAASIATVLAMTYQHKGKRRDGATEMPEDANASTH